MTTDTSWLPELEYLSDYGGDWKQYLNAIYQIFCQDFVHSKPTFQGVRLGLKRHPVIQGKEATFWHIISTGDQEMNAYRTYAAVNESAGPNR